MCLLGCTCAPMHRGGGAPEADTCCSRRAAAFRSSVFKGSFDPCQPAGQPDRDSSRTPRVLVKVLTTVGDGSARQSRPLAAQVTTSRNQEDPAQGRRPGLTTVSHLKIAESAPGTVKPEVTPLLLELQEGLVDEVTD